MIFLVTGGAGYIGSHTIRELLARGHEVVALDNLSRGHRKALEILGVPLLKVDLRDEPAMHEALKSRPFDGVVHFAAYCAAGESVENPGLYFENNVAGTSNLLNAMVAAGVKNLVFSSSCSVYGQPDRLPVTEEFDRHPESPYGESKYLCERMLPWFEGAHGLRAVALRYFNASGSSLDSLVGDDSRPATRLIPRVMKSILKGGGVSIFGEDYPTRDGTCIRDYIHVLDLASAHIQSLDYLAAGGKTDFFNVGVGVGYTNREVVETIRRASGIDFPVVMAARRPGDPAEVYADNSKVKRALGWEPTHSDLETIIRSDWAWHSSHPDGYRD